MIYKLTGTHVHLPSVHVLGESQPPQLVVVPHSSVYSPHVSPAVAQEVFCMCAATESLRLY